MWGMSGTWKQFHMALHSNFPRRELMWLGLGSPWGWLALTGHHWPQLTRQVTQNSIKGEFDPIFGVWMIWYCGYAMWAYSLSVVPQTIGWWSPNPSSLIFHLPFSSIAGMERYIAAIKVLSELPLLPSLPFPFLYIAGIWSANSIQWSLFQKYITASIKFISSSGESHAPLMLTAPSWSWFGPPAP